VYLAAFLPFLRLSFSEADSVDAGRPLSALSFAWNKATGQACDAMWMRMRIYFHSIFFFIIIIVFVVFDFFFFVVVSSLRFSPIVV
jgi:hypothetical protein